MKISKKKYLKAKATIKNYENQQSRDIVDYYFILVIIEQLSNAAKKNNKYNIETAIGEIVIHGIEYQVQLSLIKDKKNWFEEGKMYKTTIKGR